MERDLLRQIAHVLRPHATRVANMVARGVVHLVSDDTKLQLLQLGLRAGETNEGSGKGAEHFQPYGFSSVPLAGAEAVVVFPNGDRGHPLVVAVSDRRYRPTGGEGGEVTVYNHTGAKIVLTKDGDIVASAAPGREVRVDDGSGGALELPTKADVAALADFVQGLFVGGSGSAVVPPGTVPQPVGTTVLKAK